MATALKGGGSRARKRKRPAARSIDQLKRIAARCASNWFAPELMRGYGTRATRKVFPSEFGGCTLFVTSSQRPGSKIPRAFTVHRACGCEVSTVGGFMAYPTLARAQVAAKRAAKS